MVTGVYGRMSFKSCNSDGMVSSSKGESGVVDFFSISDIYDMSNKNMCDREEYAGGITRDKRRSILYKKGNNGVKYETKINY